MISSQSKSIAIAAGGEFKFQIVFFTSRCLEKNADNRPFMMELLEHPFFTNLVGPTGTDHHVSDPNDSNESDERIKSFNL